MIWTMVFTLIYLTLTAEGSYFEKSNVILKALALCYSLLSCFLFAFGAGQSLNPALGLTQSTYMVIYDYENRRDPNRDTVRNNCMLIYIIAPLVGGIIAAYAFHSHNENTKQRE